MYKIKDRTPVYSGYKVDEDGYFILPRSKKTGKLCIFREHCYEYGKNVIGLIDGAKIRTEDWEELRNEFFLVNSDKTYTHCYCVGGSDSGTVMGLNDYKTIEELLAEKRGAFKEENSIETEFKFHIGHTLEETVALAFYYKEHKKAIHRGKFEVFKDNSVFFNLRTGFMQANVDYFVEDHEGLHILECKTTASPSLWSDNDIPMSYKTQAGMHYPRCLEDFNIVSTYFACLWNTNLNDVIVREFKRRKIWEDTLEKAEAIFIDILKNGKELPKGFFEESSKAVANAIAKKHPKAVETEPVKVEDEKIVDICKQYIEINKQKSALEKQSRDLGKELAALKNPIMEFLGDNAEGVAQIDGVDYRIDFSNKAKRYTVSAANLTAIRNNEPEIYIELLEKGYITASEGRNFSIKEIKKPKEKAVKKPKKEVAESVDANG